MQFLGFYHTFFNVVMRLYEWDNLYGFDNNIYWLYGYYRGDHVRSFFGAADRHYISHRSYGFCCEGIEDYTESVPRSYPGC